MRERRNCIASTKDSRRNTSVSMVSIQLPEPTNRCSRRQSRCRRDAPCRQESREIETMEMFVFRVWLPPWQQQTYNQKEFNVLSGFQQNIPTLRGISDQVQRLPPATTLVIGKVASIQARRPKPGATTLFYLGFGQTMANFPGQHLTSSFDEFSYEGMNKNAWRGHLMPYWSPAALFSPT